MFQRMIDLMLISLLFTGAMLSGTACLAQETDVAVGNAGSSEIAFVITDKTLTELRKQELPEDVLAQLETLKDTLFSTEAVFLNAVEEVVGQGMLEQHRTLLLELAYVYDSTGRREPFKPAIETDKTATELPPELSGDECPPPLGKYDVGQFQIIGILLGEPGDRARIKAPDGESYTITVETCLGRYDGKVVTFSEDCVTIRETKRYTKGDEVSVKEEDTELCLKVADE